MKRTEIKVCDEFAAYEKSLFVINFTPSLLLAGDITQKGYEKKRTRLLSPYVPKQNSSK